MPAAPITPETFLLANLQKAPPRAPTKGGKTNALFRLTYNGEDAAFQVRGSVCRPHLTYYDNDAAGFGGKKGAYMSKPAGEVPVSVSQFKLNIDLRGARKAFHALPDVTAEDQYQLSVVNMMMAVEKFVMEACREQLRKVNSKIGADADLAAFYNSCLVGSPIDADPFYLDEKAKEQKLAPLTLSLTVYAKDRSNASDPIVIDSAQCFQITGWTQDPNYPGDPTRRKPSLSNGDFFQHCVGGANGYVVFGIGQPNIYSGKINAAPRPKMAYMDLSTRWGQGQHIDAEQAVEQAAIEW